MAVTQPPAQALAYSEARGCKEWLNALALTNIPQAQGQVLESLRALNRADFDALERLKCLELMRDKIAFLQGEQRARYFGKTLPLSPNDSTAWSTGRALLEEMEAGYRVALKPAHTGTADLKRHLALVMHRLMRYIGAQMLFHAIVYRRFDPQLWARLHQQYRDAEAAGVLDERIKDSLEGDDAGSSVMEAYAKVVLLQAAYLSELTAPQIDYTEALIRMWIRKVQVRTIPEGNTPALLPLVVDLDKPIGARPLPASDLQANHRLLDVEQLSLSMRKRIHALKQDQDPAAMGLPQTSAPFEPLHHLTRLHRLWCEGAPPRPPAKVPDEKSATLAMGFGEIHFYVTSGKVFEQPDKKRELTRQEKQDIEVFGQVTARTQSMMVSEYKFEAETWGVIDEMMGAWRLQRPQTASKGVAIGRLVAMRVGERSPFFLGMVSALVQETDGHLVATVTLFPGRPEATPVRAADARNRTTAKWVEGFRLPALERINAPASLVVPSGVAARGRGIDVWTGAPKETTVYEILERGSDFDRITTF